MSSYIESIQGIISGAEFRMHVGYLMKIRETELNKYVLKIKNTIRSIMVDEFLNYVRTKRNNVKGFSEDMNSLYYCDERKDETDLTIKKIHEKLFSCAKVELWQVKPYVSGNEVAINWFYKSVQYLNVNSSLAIGLKKLYVLHDNPDRILRELKGLLLVYHPDKNKYEVARKMYETVELVYKAVNGILKVYERHLGDTIFCNFKVFLGKKLGDIDEDAVYEDIISTHKTLRMKVYLKGKEIIESIREKMLARYRESITLEDTILEKKIDCSIDTTNQKEEKKKSCKIREEINGELKSLSKKLETELEELLNICYLIKERCKDEIENLNCMPVDNSLEKYCRQKKFESFKQVFEKLDKEEEEINVFLSRSKIQSNLKYAKYYFYYHAKRLYNGTPTPETEYDFIDCYSQLKNEYQETIKNFKIDKTIDFKAKLEELRIRNDELNKKYKTRVELDKELLESLSVTKDLKKTSTETRKEIERLKNEREISERRAEEVEAKIKIVEAELEVERRRAKREEDALGLLYDDAIDLNISIKKLRESKDVFEYLEYQYTLLILSEDYGKEFKNFPSEIKDIPYCDDANMYRLVLNVTIKVEDARRRNLYF